MKAGEPPSASSQATSPASFLNFEVHEKRGVGQPPSLKETRKRNRRLELENRNQSLEVFPAGDDPCKGYGVWTLTPGLRTFTAFQEHSKEVWEPRYYHALRQIKQRSNDSHLAFPDGNDPCKELGIWRSLEPAAISNRFRFDPFEDVPEKVYKQKSESALRILNAQYREALESRNISGDLFIDDNDPCKGYGAWIIINTDTGAVQGFKFNEVSDTIWVPRYKRALQHFNSLPEGERTSRIENARLHNSALGVKDRVSRFFSWLMGKK